MSTTFVTLSSRAFKSMMYEDDVGAFLKIYHFIAIRIEIDKICDKHFSPFSWFVKVINEEVFSEGQDDQSRSVDEHCSTAILGIDSNCCVVHQLLTVSILNIQQFPISWQKVNKEKVPTDLELVLFKTMQGQRLEAVSFWVIFDERQLKNKKGPPWKSIVLKR